MQLTAYEVQSVVRSALSTPMKAAPPERPRNDKQVRRLQHKLGFTRATADCLFDLKRQVDHLQTFTNYHCAWCGAHYTTKWGYGNLKGAEAAPATTSRISSSYGSGSSNYGGNERSSSHYGSTSTSTSTSSTSGGSTSGGRPEAEVLDWKYVDKQPSVFDRQAASRLCPSTSSW